SGPLTTDYCLLTTLLLSHAKQMLLAAEEELAVGYRRRGDDRLAQIVLGEGLHLPARTQHADPAFLAGEVDPAVARDPRGVILLAQPLLADERALGGVETEADALVAGHVDVTPVRDRRRHEGAGLLVDPHAVAGGHVAGSAAVEANAHGALARADDGQ